MLQKSIHIIPILPLGIEIVWESIYMNDYTINLNGV